MCLIREFDDAVHYEFAADAMPDLIHLYVGEEASAMGICMNLNEKIQLQVHTEVMVIVLQKDAMSLI